MGVPQIIAHRGASWRAPENTLFAVRLAWEEGADAVEVDVHRTRDNQVVVIHDPTLGRTTSGHGRVAEKTLAELSTLDAGSWKAPEYRGERIPSLTDVLAVIPPEKHLYIEIKDGPEIAPALVRSLSRHPAEGVTLISFHFDVLTTLRPLLPGHEMLYLVDYRFGQSTADLRREADRSRAAGFQGLDISRRWPVDRAMVSAFRTGGQKLVVWTVDDPAEARDWIQRGADGITTNHPGALRQALRPSTDHP